MENLLSWLLLTWSDLQRTWGGGGGGGYKVVVNWYPLGGGGGGGGELGLSVYWRSALP